MVDWTAEKIAQLNTIEKVEALRDNAARHRNQTIVELCEADLARRNPPRIKQPRLPASSEDRAGHYVSEFHFVCPNESEVERTQTGLVRTGTWVVAAAHAEAAVRYGSKIALHITKSQLSYLQGTIKEWHERERQPRNADGELVKTKHGIEFLFEPTTDALSWKGESSGEKGYAWSPLPRR
jgi:hypothetical protein